MTAKHLGGAVLLVSLLAAALAFDMPALRPQAHDHGGHLHGATGHVSPFESRMNQDMARMMRDMHAPGHSGNPDVDFLAMMIPHHQGAIDMARLALEHGEDPLTRRLAEEIIASQQAEIEAMRARLAILRRGPDPEPGGFPTLGGTRGR